MAKNVGIKGVDMITNIGSILLPYKPRRLAVGEVDYMEAVPEGNLRTVVFLCVDQSDVSGTRRVPKATGLLVTVPVENSPNHTVHYIVTARHCIEKARQFGDLYIRMNRKSGKFAEFKTSIKDWYEHDSADVAAIPITSIPLPPGIKSEDLDCASILVSSFVRAPNYECVLNGRFGNKVIQPRVGHQVYLLGLFTEHHGEERNLPIARFGHISRMPTWMNVKINETWVHMIAYLIEFHSIGGHSGAPVFFLYPMIVEDQKTLQLSNGERLPIPVSTDFVWHTGFMGLVSGHYEIETGAKTPGAYGQVQVDMNSGIAYVTPAEAVRELLMRSDLVEHRKKFKPAIEAKRPTPTLDFGVDSNLFTKKKIPR